MRRPPAPGRLFLPARAGGKRRLRSSETPVRGRRCPAVRSGAAAAPFAVHRQAPGEHRARARRPPGDTRIIDAEH